MELDKELVQTRIDIIEENLKEVQKIVEEGYEKFSRSMRDQLAAKHALLESIEACIDVANHIIATKSFRRPLDYKDVFKVLEENRLIDKNLSERLQEMAKFRNFLIHRYVEVDVGKLLKIIKRDIKDIKDFVLVILKIIKR